MLTSQFTSNQGVATCLFCGTPAEEKFFSGSYETYDACDCPQSARWHEARKARFERSRAERSWDAKDVVARVFPNDVMRMPKDTGYDGTQHTSFMHGALSDYMRAMGVRLPIVDLSAPPIKDAEIVPPERIPHAP